MTYGPAALDWSSGWSQEWSDLAPLLLPWAVQLVASWLAFLAYMCVDARLWAKGSHVLNAAKLPTRHPLEPFWWSQLRMVPQILYNQLVAWPLASVLLIWPAWAMNRACTHTQAGGAGCGGSGRDGWGWWTLPVMFACMLVSDQMWYWSHRFMHTPWAWRHWHKLHHIAEQAALSATYVHAAEYAMWATAMQLPFALVGFPLGPYLLALAWGCATGAGAHSGYSFFADADKHNAHHLYHNVNFGLLMVADAMYGTHWSPGDPAPRVWSEARDIWNAFPDMRGSEASSVHVKSMPKPWEADKDATPEAAPQHIKAA